MNSNPNIHLASECFHNEANLDEWIKALVCENDLKRCAKNFLSRNQDDFIMGKQLNIRDILCLKAKEWINNSFLNNFGSSLATASHSRIVFYPSNNFSALYNGGKLYKGETFNSQYYKSPPVKSLSSILNYISDPSKQYFCSPINFTDYHWALLIIRNPFFSNTDVDKVEIFYYDSMSSSYQKTSSRTNSKMIKNIAEHLLDDLFGRSYDAPNKPYNYKEINGPQQSNGYDCGMFVLLFLLHLASGISIENINFSNTSKAMLV
jgi:Ulp1 family protease